MEGKQWPWVVPSPFGEICVSFPISSLRTRADRRWRRNGKTWKLMCVSVIIMLLPACGGTTLWARYGFYRAKRAKLLLPISPSTTTVKIGFFPGEDRWTIIGWRGKRDFYVHGNNEFPSALHRANIRSCVSEWVCVCEEGRWENSIMAQKDFFVAGLYCSSVQPNQHTSYRRGLFWSSCWTVARTHRPATRRKNKILYNETHNEKTWNTEGERKKIMSDFQLTNGIIFFLLRTHAVQ